ncbi:O-methyltransferase [Insulibacter thermoxylanivorax]|nr:O-methyltransferase [Insulibacter thermoxylanivorax]
MMNLDQVPLIRQLDLVFRQLNDELAHLSSGIIFVHIRNNVIGKFGIRHDPIQNKGDGFELNRTGLSERHRMAFRQLALESLKYKKQWTHGEIQFEFALKNNTLVASVQFESNYNMANLLSPDSLSRLSKL